MSETQHGAREVGAGFDQAAGSYDDLLVHNRMGASRLVAALPAGDYPDIVDVGCGTGFASFEMHDQHATTHVVGVDASPEMLEVFRRSAAAVDGFAVDLLVGDAARLPVADGVADAVISTMAFHWYPDKDAALREMARVAKPGGLVALLTAGRGTDAELRAVLEGITPPVPAPWIGVFDAIHRDVPEMHAMMEAAGLEPVDVWSETRYRWIEPVNYLARLQAVAAHLSSHLTPEEVEGHVARLGAALDAASGPRGFAYTFVKLFAIARKPG